jgi:pilus assembly protein CpaB
MRAKSGILLIISLVCGTIASVGISQVVLDQRSGSEGETVEIFVAVADIGASSKITADLLKLERWPVERLPAGWSNTLEEVEGRFAAQRLFEGEPIMLGKLIDAKGSIASQIPPGHKIFDLALQRSSGASVSYIGPGDRIDVTGFFEQDRSEKTTGRSITVLRNVPVVAVDGILLREGVESSKGNSDGSRTLQLLVRDSQYDIIHQASNLGSIRVALVPPGRQDTGEPDESREFLEFLESRSASSSQAGSYVAAPAPQSGRGATSGGPAAAMLGDSASSQAPSSTQRGGQAVADKTPRRLTVVSPKGVEMYEVSHDGQIPKALQSKSSSAKNFPDSDDFSRLFE